MRTRLLTLAAALSSLTLHAQTPAPTPTPETPVAGPAKPTDTASPAPPEKKPATVGAAEGFSIQSDDGDYRLNFRAYTHADARFYVDDDAELGTNQFLLRRVRPILQGTVARHFDFNITPDFGSGTATLQDAYLDVRYTPKARFRFGKTKVPISLERLQSATALTFVERSFVSALVPNRDIGLGSYGELSGGVFSYVLGAYGGAVDGGSADLDTNDGKDLVARLLVSPFKNGGSAFKELGFGVAGSIGDQEGPLPTYRSGGQLTIASYVSGAVADGRRARLVPQLSLYSGPFSLVGEYAQSDAWVKGPQGERMEVGVRAWQTTATWTVTGEPASFSAVRPRDPFDPGQGHWGAFELGARVNGFEIEDAAFAAGLFDPARSVRDAFAWGVVLNWYLNRHVKQVLSYERTTFTAGAADGADRPAENALFFRTQLSF
jgi:phosphate-selective porin OprO and OprP